MKKINYYKFRIVAKDGKKFTLFRFSCTSELFKLASSRSKFLLKDFDCYDPCVCSWVIALSELNISFTIKSISNEE